MHQDDNNLTDFSEETQNRNRNRKTLSQGGNLRGTQKQSNPSSTSQSHHHDNEGIVSMNHHHNNLHDNFNDEEIVQEQHQQHQSNQQQQNLLQESLSQSDEPEEPDSNSEEEEEETDTLDKDEEDVQKLLTEINNEAIADLKNDETDTALDSLKRGEQMLEFITSEGREVDRNLIIVILYNQACCYQRLNMLPDCASYLDGTIYNLEQKVTNFQEDEEFLQMMSQQQSMTTAGANDFGEALANNSLSAVSNNLSSLEGANWEKAMNSLTPEEQLKKFNISSKLFKLRYLCKYHLQLCAVLSQLLRNKEALMHGMMASFYCQELIRNTYYLCQGYISKLQGEKQQAQKDSRQKSSSQRSGNAPNPTKQTKKTEKKGLTEKQKKGNFSLTEGSISAENPNDDEDLDPENISIGHPQNYYVEEDEKFLNTLITNCEPILSQIVSKFDHFNDINSIERAFEQQKGTLNHNQAGGMYGESSDEDQQDETAMTDSTDILKPIIEEFSIKSDVDLQNLAGVASQQPVKNSLSNTSPNNGISLNKQKRVTKDGYKNLKNNYLARIQSPTQNSNFEDSAERQQKVSTIMPDEPTPEQMFLQRRNSTNQSAYYNTRGIGEEIGVNSSSTHTKLQDNVKTILGVKDQDDWIFNLNIGNVMHLLPMSLDELNLHVDNSHELSRDAMLEKIILLSVSYFCVGTELRFLSKQFSTQAKTGQQGGLDPETDLSDSQRYRLEDSEMWHAMALETCSTFLPSECPLVSHMIMSFQKHHSPAMTTIKEGEELDEVIKVLRPLNEVKSDTINYHQIIRDLTFNKSKKDSDKNSSHKEQSSGAIESISTQKKGSGKVQKRRDQQAGQGQFTSKTTSTGLGSLGRPPKNFTGVLSKGGKDATKSSQPQNLKDQQDRKQHLNKMGNNQLPNDPSDNFYSMDELEMLLGLENEETALHSPSKNSLDTQTALQGQSINNNMEPDEVAQGINQGREIFNSQSQTKMRLLQEEIQLKSQPILSPQQQTSAKNFGILTTNQPMSKDTAKEKNIQQKKNLQNLLSKLSEVQQNSPNQDNPPKPESDQLIPVPVVQNTQTPRKQKIINSSVAPQNFTNQVHRSSQQSTGPLEKLPLRSSGQPNSNLTSGAPGSSLPSQNVASALQPTRQPSAPTTIASLAEENQILMKYLQKKQLKKQKDLAKEPKKGNLVGSSSNTQAHLQSASSSKQSQMRQTATAQGVTYLSASVHNDLLSDMKKQTPRPQSKKINRSNQADKLIGRSVKNGQFMGLSRDQIIPASAQDHRHHMQHPQSATGKKVVRRVKKSSATTGKDTSNSTTLSGVKKDAYFVDQQFHVPLSMKQLSFQQSSQNAKQSSSHAKLVTAKNSSIHHPSSYPNSTIAKNNYLSPQQKGFTNNQQHPNNSQQQSSSNSQAVLATSSYHPPQAYLQSQTGASSIKKVSSSKSGPNQQPHLNHQQNASSKTQSGSGGGSQNNVSNIRLKQLVQLQSKAIQGINSAHVQHTVSVSGQGKSTNSATSGGSHSKSNTKGVAAGRMQSHNQQVVVVGGGGMGGLTAQQVYNQSSAFQRPSSKFG